ncbi:MAG TPA: DNA-binding protein [Candidatus Angelobacter sp.]|nr:DNA-binding protein [Candidatus Angelobacter sp.]
MKLKIIGLGLCLILVGHCAAAPLTLTTIEAKKHVGENATVCGLVVDVHFAAGSKGLPTFVNLDKPFPNQVFTVLIWGDDLPKFAENPAKWQNRKVCATGTISEYRGSPEIVASSQDQVTISDRTTK